MFQSGRTHDESDPNCAAVIVTGGAGSGIGHGITEALADEGWAILIVDRDAEAAGDLQTELKREGKKIETLVADITVAGVAQHAVESALKYFGRLDGLVNNAGVGLCKPIAEVSDDEFDRILNVDLRGAFHFCRAAIPAMMAIGGSIVNIGSIHAHKSVAGYGLYASVKSGLDGLTRGIAIDYGLHRIRANSVHPGYVESPQNRDLISRFTPDAELWIHHYASTKQLLPEIPSARQVGELVAFLLGPKSAAITGQSIAIDAGSSIMLYGKEGKP